MSSQVKKHLNKSNIKANSRYYIAGLDRHFNVDIYWQGDDLRDCLSYFNWLMVSYLGETVDFQWFESSRRYKWIK